MTSEKTQEELVEENALLKANLKRLHERIDKLEKETEHRAKTGASTRLLRLVKEKDKALETATEDLEDKQEELARTVTELGTKNAELATSISAMRLYQQIFESDPSAIIGFDGSRAMMQFNDAAVAVFGESIREMMFTDVAMLDFGLKADAAGEKLNALLERGEQFSEKVEIAGKLCWMHAFPLRGEDGITGGILRIMDA